MNAFTDTFLLTYAALFPIVNPVGSAPLFLGLTQFCTDKERNALALRVAINSFFLLLGSLVIGSHVLEFFGISLPVVRIGGGLVVTSFGWKLLNSDERPDGERDARKNSSPIPDPFYPLTMPLTVGPGSISVAITLGSQRPGHFGWAELAQFGSAAVAGILVIALTIYFCYRFAESTVSRLGRTATNVVVRLSAFIMLCIGIQILWNGWSALNALH
ncbi:MAG TPA: MarC family protein [Rhizomicrobium sp.]|jgi:multiple antibiotic resistance protein|nr:MarC family protein [Rhizomicrobium sp.]